MPNRIFGGTRSGAGGVSVSMHPPLEFILRQTGAFKASLLDLHPLWELFEPITAQMEEEQFDTEGHGDWPPLADSTLNQKLAHGWPMAMLDRTGDLRTSLTDPGSAADKGAMQMTWSTDIEYAHFHQTGGYVVGRPPQRQVIPDPVPVKQRRKFEKAMVGWINLTARETFGRIAA